MRRRFSNFEEYHKCIKKLCRIVISVGLVDNGWERDSGGGCYKDVLRGGELVQE